MNILSILIIPMLLLIIFVIGVYKGVNCFDAFKEGAREGLLSIFKLIPTYIGLFSAVAVFRSSGLIEWVVELVSPVFKIPDMLCETLPLMVMRPVSGSASLALLKNILSKNGADNVISLAACIMMGSTETIFYTMSVYTSETEIKRMPGVLFISLVANAVSCLGAVVWVLLV